MVSCLLKSCFVRKVIVLFEFLFEMIQCQGNIGIGLKMCYQLLGAVNGSVLATCTAKVNLKMFKVASKVGIDTVIDDSIYIFQKRSDLRLLFKEFLNGFVHTCQCFVFVNTTWVVQCSAVKNKSSTIS